MNRDGIACVGVMLLLAFVAGKLALLFMWLVGIIVAWTVIMIIAAYLNQKGVRLPSALTIVKGTPEMNNILLPQALANAEQMILQSICNATEGYDQANARFINLINAYDTSVPIPPCMKNAIVKKLMYEYYRKYGNLVFPTDGSQSVDVQDAMRPLAPDEQQPFYSFCVVNNK